MHEHMNKYSTELDQPFDDCDESSGIHYFDALKKDSAENKDIFRKRSLSKLPEIKNSIKNNLEEKIKADDVLTWEDADVSKMIAVHATDVLSRLGNHINNNLPYENEHDDVAILRSFIYDDFLWNKLSDAIMDIVRTIVVNIRSGRDRMSTIKDMRLKENSHSNGMGAWISNESSPLEYANLRHVFADSNVKNDNFSVNNPVVNKTTILPPPLNPGSEALSLQEMAGGPESTDNIDDGWDEAPQSIRNELQDDDFTVVNDDEWEVTDENLNTVAEVATKVESIKNTEIPKAANPDSISPVTVIENEDSSNEDSSADLDSQILNLPMKISINKRRLLTAVAIAALFGGLYTKHQTETGKNNFRLAGTAVADVSKAAGKQIYYAEKANSEKKEKAVAKEVKDFNKFSRPIVADHVLLTIANIPNPHMRDKMYRIMVDAHFKFDTAERNTVDQMLDPFFRIANKDQTQQLKELATKFNVGLYASAVRRFQRINKSERDQLIYDNTHKDHEVYTMMKKMRHGDPMFWPSTIQGKPYEEVKAEEMMFYESFEADMKYVGLQKVFVGGQGDMVSVWIPEEKRFNIVIEEAIKIIFGNNAYTITDETPTDETPKEPDKTTTEEFKNVVYRTPASAPAVHSKSMNKPPVEDIELDDEIPVVWDLSSIEAATDNDTQKDNPNPDGGNPPSMQKNEDDIPVIWDLSQFERESKRIYKKFPIDEKKDVKTPKKDPFEDEAKELKKIEREFEKLLYFKELELIDKGWGTEKYTNPFYDPEEGKKIDGEWL
jgi:hypothetical protein